MPLRLVAGVGAMAVFLALAGGQPSVVRAVLMGAAALLIRERGSRVQPLGVLLSTLVVMLLLNPAWARSIGFQLSAAATAGLVLSAQPLEQWLLQHGSQPLFSCLKFAGDWTKKIILKRDVASLIDVEV